jgi:hypothetical protein
LAVDWEVEPLPTTSDRPSHAIFDLVLVAVNRLIPVFLLNPATSQTFKFANPRPQLSGLCKNNESWVARDWKCYDDIAFARYTYTYTRSRTRCCYAGNRGRESSASRLYLQPGRRFCRPHLRCIFVCPCHVSVAGCRLIWSR